MIWTFYIHFRPPSEGGFTLSLALIGEAFLEKKTFEIVNGRTTTTDDAPWVDIL